MPTTVDIPDVGTVEFPDSMSQDDIKATIKRKFYSGTTTTGTSQPDLSKPIVSLSQMERNRAAATTLPKRELPSTTPKTDTADYAGESLLGISPQDIPSGAGTTVPGITIPLSAMAKTAAGAAQFVTSPRGLTQIGLAATPAAPAVYIKWAYDMLKGGVESAKNVGESVATLIRDHINHQMAPETGSEKPPVDEETVQRLADESVNAAVMILGGVSAGAHGVSRAKTVADNIRPVAPATAAELEKGPDAIQQETGEVLRPVQSQSGGGVQEVPAEGTSPEAGPRSAPTEEQKGQDVEQLSANAKKFKGLQQQMSEAVKAKDYQKAFELQKESEPIKNLYEGHVPVDPFDLRPAIDIEGMPHGELGDTHADVLEGKGIDPDTIPHEDPRRGFIDINDPTKFINRTDAEKKSGLKGTADAGGLDSQDLPKQKGGGAAELGEVGSPTGQDIYGVAERVRAERAAAGQVEEIPAGEGINTPESIGRGRALLQADPGSAERMMREFESTKALSADAMAVARAHGENLAAKARTIEEQSGTDSDEYRAARDELTEWDKRSKAMQTEWHKTGMAQQGETDIDTGSFTGLERAYTRETGDSFTPEQGGKATKIAKGVKEAEGATAEAEKSLADTLEKELPRTARVKDAEQAALDAASKTVRENAIRLAKADEQSRIAKTEQEMAVAKIQQDKARKALEKAQKEARDAAVRLAKKESEVKEVQRLDDQEKAERKALDAASKTVREAAAKLAKAENDERSAQAGRDKSAAKVQSDAARKALEAADKRAREAAAKHAETERKLQANPQIRVWNAARDYINKGLGNFDDIRNKVATDLGMSVKQVTRWLAYNPRVKSLADDLWRAKQTERTLKLQAKRWLADQTLPWFQRTGQKVPRILFGLKVFGHGTVALGTHAPMLAFQPQFWPEYVSNFGKMYKMVFRPAYHEMQMQDLVRRENYTTAQRAGLQNNPFQYEEYVDPNMNALIRKLVGGGSRGYSVLKLLRQDVFDHYWDNLPKTQQIPEIAQALADSINHVTGVTKKGAPQGSNILLFAPRLEASRVAWLAVDPAKSFLTFANWENASFGDRMFAINQVKEKLTVAATMATLLGLNQAILSYSGSNQQINFDNPMESDFLKFKGGGMTVSYGNPMLTLARLPIRLWEIGASDGGKLRNVVYPDERAGTALFDYLRSQESPFASLITDLVLRADPTGRPLPHSTQPVPTRLKKKGIEPYTWGEFLTEQLSPIPMQEAIKEVWGDQFGMSEQQQKALATMLFMWGTGGRMSEDLNAQ